MPYVGSPQYLKTATCPRKTAMICKPLADATTSGEPQISSEKYFCKYVPILSISCFIESQSLLWSLGVFAIAPSADQPTGQFEISSRFYETNWIVVASLWHKRQWYRLWILSVYSAFDFTAGIYITKTLLTSLEVGFQ